MYEYKNFPIYSYLIVNMFCLFLFIINLGLQLTIIFIGD